MFAHKPEKSKLDQAVPAIRIEISPEPSPLERAVIEAAAHHHLQNSQDAEPNSRSRYGATPLREFER